MRKVLGILLCFTITGLWAQGVTISGRIVDAETLDPLPFAHIFIDQTTIVTVSDTDGNYVLEHVENGDYKIVFSYVGYEMHFATITINNENVRLSVRLVPMKAMLESVEVRGTKDKEWEKQLKQFNRVFFGNNSIAKECKILNPWVLDFRIDWDKTFRATASEPLKIENKALGYNIECILQGFSFDKKSYKIKGLYKFEEVNTLDKKEAAKWTRNRKLAYQNSLRFLCKSILDNHEEENGFKIYYDLRPDLYTQTSGYFGNELGKTLTEYDSKSNVQPSGRPGYYKIIANKRLQIHHTTQFADSKTYRDLPNPVSWIELEKGYILVSQDGNVINNEDITTSGELYNNRIASMLPTNYSPGTLVVINYITKRAIAKRLQERVYTQTDKGMYYPGEIIWMKVYTNYANQSVRDSLSTVLYAELINSKKEVIKSKLLKLDSTYAWGEFELADDTPPGQYYLRAYTEWMLNYGPDILYYKPVIVLDKSVILSSNDADLSNDDFTITVSRDRFKWPGSIEVEASLDSNKSNTVANCSISVTPIASQFPSFMDIHDALFFPEDMPAGTLADFTHEIENSFTIKGQLYRKNKKNTYGTVTAIQGMMDSLYHIRTNRKGFFEINNLTFTDTSTFTFQGRNKKGKVFGNIRLIEKEVPPIEFPPINFKKLELDTTHLNYPILIASTINDSTQTTPDKDSNDRDIQNSRTISNADYTLGPSQLASIPIGTNIIDALIGRVPGLSLDGQTGKLSIRGRSGNDKQNNEPLVVVDGNLVNFSSGSSQTNQESERVTITTQTSSNVQLQGLETNSLREATANGSSQNASSTYDNKFSQQNSDLKVRDLMGHITVEFVTRVEVNLRGDARYGSGSTNGVISIYTQKTPRSNAASTMDSFVINGFAKPREFVRANLLSLNKSYNPTTLYWNPSLQITSSKSTKISFEPPREPGQYIIRIEGMTTDGSTVSGSIQFNLEKPIDQTKAATSSDQHQN